MLTANQLRQVAARSGARDIANVEIDVILTDHAGVDDRRLAGTGNVE